MFTHSRSDVTVIKDSVDASYATVPHSQKPASEPLSCSLTLQSF